MLDSDEVDDAAGDIVGLELSVVVGEALLLPLLLLVNVAIADSIAEAVLIADNVAVLLALEVKVLRLDSDDDGDANEVGELLLLPAINIIIISECDNVQKNYV